MKHLCAVLKTGVTIFTVIYASIAVKSQAAGQSLTGAWKAVADQQVNNKGQVVVQDTSIRGLLIYTDAGKMNVQILWPGVRRPILNDSIMQRDGNSTGLGIGTNSWTADERGKLIDSYDAYFGDYFIDWKKQVVSHVITGDLRPEKEATVFNRRFVLTGDTLYLRSTDSTMAWQVKFVRVKKQ